MRPIACSISASSADIRYILRRLPAPEQRLNMLFSATLSQRVLELAYEHMNDPTLVRIEPDKMTVDRVRQVIYYPSNDEKPRLLVGLLKHMDPRRSMVFVNTRRAAEEIEQLLRGNDINAEAISGDVPQRKRLRMLRDFHEGTLAVLIGTDVASRGLHIPDVSHVFNYDLPQDPEDYVHRIGRTARAGAEGDAISFGCEEYVISLPDIEAYIGRKLPVAAVPQEMLPEIVTTPERPRLRRRHGSRGRGSGPARGGSGGGRSGSAVDAEIGPAAADLQTSRGGGEPRHSVEAAKPTSNRAAAPARATLQPQQARRSAKRQRRRRRDRRHGRIAACGRSGPPDQSTSSRARLSARTASSADSVHARPKLRRRRALSSVESGCVIAKTCAMPCVARRVSTAQAVVDE